MWQLLLISSSVWNCDHPFPRQQNFTVQKPGVKSGRNGKITGNVDVIPSGGAELRLISHFFLEGTRTLLNFWDAYLVCFFRKLSEEGRFTVYISSNTYVILFRENILFTNDKLNQAYIPKN